MAGKAFSQKPTGLLKWALHLPTWLFRARLGFVMGSRFLMIEHRGRKSDKPYRTALEVAGRYPEKNEYIVTSGTGPKADWYLNLRAGKLDGVWLGSRRHTATVRFLDAEEAGAVFEDYERAHPKAAARLMDQMGVSHDGTDEGRIDMMGGIPMVSFTPVS